MSYYVANENGMVDQFASGRGFMDLTRAAAGNKILKDFFDNGFVESAENISPVIVELEKLAAASPPDIASSARTLAKLITNQDIAIIYNGNESAEAPDNDPENAAEV